MMATGPMYTACLANIKKSLEGSQHLLRTFIKVRKMLTAEELLDELKPFDSES